MSRFVSPGTTVLTISNGDTLRVRTRLNAGEQRACYARMRDAGLDGRVRVDPMKHGPALITAYLLDWSLTDEAGQPVVIRELPVESLEATLDALDTESFTEIREAIEAHEERTAAARALSKNSQGGEKESSAISPSPTTLAGASTGSVN